MINSMVKHEIVIPALVAFAICFLLGPVVIPLLRRLKAGQTVRDDGPEAHLKKTGTPTMGGIMIIIAMLVPSLFYVRMYPKTVPVIILTVGMGLVGFMDDYIKVVLKRSMGLRAWQKLAMQLIVTGAFLWYVHFYLKLDMAMKIPFWKGHVLDLGWLNIPLLFLVVLGTDNATNLTDGVDGLLSSVTAVVAAFFALYAAIHGNAAMPLCCALIGALLGFLVFNCHPAKVFMGDTGSLAIGGFIAAIAYVLQLQLFLVIIGLIYVCEALSVIIQVTYFKLTHGKRVFKMAPIHHHFELSGWSETKVVTVFTIVTILCCLVGILAAW